MKAPTLILTVSVLSLCSCQAIKDVPVSVAYKAGVGGHDITAAFSTRGGLTLYGEKRVRPQK